MVGIFLGTWRSLYDSVYLEVVITGTLSLLMIIFMGTPFSSRDVLLAIHQKNPRDDVSDRMLLPSERMLLPSDERIRTLAEQTIQEKDEDNRKIDDSVPERNSDQVHPVGKGKTLVKSLNTAMNSTSNMDLQKGEECKISLEEDTQI